MDEDLSSLLLLWLALAAACPSLLASNNNNVWDVLGVGILLSVCLSPFRSLSFCDLVFLFLLWRLSLSLSLSFSLSRFRLVGCIRI